MRWIKFVCPNCNKKFRKRIDDKVNVLETKDGSLFECHVHCPRCETYIPYRERL